MTNRTALTLVGFAVAIMAARGDEPAKAVGPGRVIQGTVVTAAGKPVEGARVLIGEFGSGMSFVNDAAATTDARGQYRVSPGQFSWAKGALRALVLFPGFEIGDRRVEPGVATANFELAAQPWKETLVRLEDESGKAVAGVEVQCLLGEATWARPKTDAAGSFRLAMAPELWVGLSANPDGARPIKMLFAVRKNGPASITLPVLQPIRGRVLNPDGKPAPDVAVGRWITFGSDGTGEMLPFFNGALAFTDREGRFAIAPEVQLKGSQLENPKSPHLPWALCFADRSFRRAAYRFFDPTRAAPPLEVTLEPARRVRVPITGEFLGEYPRAALNTEISIVPRSDAPDIKYYFITRTMMIESKAAGPVLEEYLPAGTYDLKTSLRDENDVTRGKATRRVVVSTGEESPIDLPPLELGPPDHASWLGKPAPEISAVDLDTGKPVRLADLRGKVVVLDFWGYWCGPCTGSMPHLMDLHEKFKGRPLEIVALHDQSVQSRADYDQKIAPARRIMWSGRDLPFRVLLDRPDPKKPDDRDPEGTGTTCKRYAITGFPTLFVIGPDGTLVEKVGHSQHQRLEPLVDELLKTAEAR